MADELIARGIRLDTGALKSDVRQAAAALDRLARSIDQDERKAREASAAFDTMGSKLKAIGAAVGGLYVVQKALQNLERGARFVFNTNVELQKLDALLKTVTGSAQRGEAAFDMITRFAINTPFEIQNLTTAFVDLRARGVVPTEDRLRGLGNIAAAFQGDITDLTQAVISGANGMSRPLKAFGFDMEISGDKAVVSFMGVRREINLGVEELSAFVAEMGNTGNQASAMSDQMKTLGGRLSNLEDSLSKTAKAAGDNGLNAEIGEMIGLLDETIGQSDDFAAAVGGTMADAIRTLRGAIEDVKPLLEFIARFSGGALGRSSVPDFSSNVKRAVESEDSLFAVYDMEQQLRQQLGAFQAAESALAELEGGGASRTSRFGFTPAAVSVPAVMAGLRATVPDALAKFGIDSEGKSTSEVLGDIRAVRRELEESIDAVKARGSLLALGPDRGFTEDPETVVTGTKKTDPVRKAMEDFAAGEREIQAMAAALRGTGVEFDATQERADLLEQTIRALAATGRADALPMIAGMSNELGGLTSRIQESVAWAERVDEISKLAREADQEWATLQDRLREMERAEALQEFQEDLERARSAAEAVTGSFEDALVSVLSTTEGMSAAVRTMVQTMLADLARLAIRQQITGPLFNYLTGLFGGSDVSIPDPPAEVPRAPAPPMASGGPVAGGGTYLVGERGPEMFVPGRNGRVIPNHDLGGGAVGPTFNLIIQGVVDEAAADAVVEKGRGAILQTYQDARDMGLI